MVLVLIRHGERLDYVEKGTWTASSDRPWDTPLTQHGKENQAVKAGERIRTKLEELGLPPVSHVYSSPLLRCVETAVGVKRGLGKPELKVKVETKLVEAMMHEWYHSWAIKGISDSSWAIRVDDVTKHELHEKALAPSHTLFLVPESEQEHVDWEYSSNFNPNYTIHDTESHDSLVERIGTFALEVHANNPHETVVLVSHGGPTAALYHYLTQQHSHKVGFTAISILEKKDNDEPFYPHLTSCTEHLQKTDDLGFATAFDE